MLFFNRIIRLIDKILLKRRLDSLNYHIKQGNIIIGKHTYGIPNISWDRYSHSKILIGSFCSIAENVTFFNGSNHNVKWISTYPFRIMFNMEGKYDDGHPSTKGNIIIGNDVWIASNVTILSGVEIGDGAVIGANSLVTRNIEPYSVYAGNPARFVKKRFSEDQIEKLLMIKWWAWHDDDIKNAVHLLCSDNINEFIKEFGK